jgi:hydroxypyruvate isomerase
MGKCSINLYRWEKQIHRAALKLHPTMPIFNANLSWLFQEVPFLDRFEAAAKAGFKGVEVLFPFDYTPDEIAAALKAHHLEMVLINTPPGKFGDGERGLAALPGREGEFRDAFDQALAYAQTLRCARIHVMAGITKNVVQEAAQRTLMANLEFALQKVAGTHLLLLLEPINSRDIPGYFLTTIEQADNLLSEFASPKLKIQFDWYHAQIMGGDLTRRTQKFFSKIGHFQLAGVPDRSEPNLGEVNFPHLFHLVDMLRYEGWIGCEYRPGDRTEDGLGWLPQSFYA